MQFQLQHNCLIVSFTRYLLSLFTKLQKYLATSVMLRSRYKKKEENASVYLVFIELTWHKAAFRCRDEMIQKLTF